MAIRCGCRRRCRRGGVFRPGRLGLVIGNADFGHEIGNVRIDRRRLAARVVQMGGYFLGHVAHRRLIFVVARYRHLGHGSGLSDRLRHFRRQPSRLLLLLGDHLRPLFRGHRFKRAQEFLADVGLAVSGLGGITVGVAVQELHRLFADAGQVIVDGREVTVAEGKPLIEEPVDHVGEALAAGLRPLDLQDGIDDQIVFALACPPCPDITLHDGVVPSRHVRYSSTPTILFTINTEPNRNSTLGNWCFSYLFLIFS